MLIERHYRCPSCHADFWWENSRSVCPECHEHELLVLFGRRLFYRLEQEYRCCKCGESFFDTIGEFLEQGVLHQRKCPLCGIIGEHEEIQRGEFDD